MTTDWLNSGMVGGERPHAPKRPPTKEDGLRFVTNVPQILHSIEASRLGSIIDRWSLAMLDDDHCSGISPKKTATAHTAVAVSFLRLSSRLIRLDNLPSLDCHSCQQL